MASTDEKRKTLTNDKSEIKEARVIANYGDPGLDEDYHFDILSRFVIVKLESYDRLLTQDRWSTMLAVVKRPEHLWVKTEGGQAASPASQKRSDVLGNINVGSALNPSVNGIPRINKPYQLGDVIKIRKMPAPFTANQDPIYTSSFNVWNANTWLYNTWHQQGSNLPYFANGQGKVGSLNEKTIQPSSTPGFFNFYLNKYQYEAMILQLNNGDSNMTGLLTQLFLGSFAGPSLVYSANGGYIFNNFYFLNMACIEYEDINADNKQRTVSQNDCIPLVVTTPNTFPTPKVRQVGTIAYNPTYATITKT